MVLGTVEVLVATDPPNRVSRVARLVFLVGRSFFPNLLLAVAPVRGKNSNGMVFIFRKYTFAPRQRIHYGIGNRKLYSLQ